MKTQLIALFILFALSATSCIIIEEEMPQHNAEIRITEAFSYGSLILSTGTASLDLRGVASDMVDLLITYKEHEPSDAVLSLTRRGIETETKSGKNVLITSISGTVPENLDIFVNTGTGAVNLKSIYHSATIEVKSGTGAVDMSDIQSVKRVKVNSGTGRFRLEEADIDELLVTTGTGSVTLIGSKIDYASIDTGTGSIRLEKTAIAEQELHTQTGRIIRDKAF